MAAATTFNPFPGLRPFQTEEDYLFFGREGQSEDILSRLRQTRFLAVVGTSGSGKSSLIRAGLLPYMFGGFMAGAGSHWRVALLRPGSDPIGNLARALNDPVVLGPVEEPEADPSRNEILLEVTLRRSGLGLVEATRHARLPAADNLLVVVDQFEELFRFAEVASSLRKEDDAAAFVKLLLEATGQTELPVYVVITMRSDFIGDCARYRDLPEAVTSGLYLIPRMSREQRRAAIEDPAKVGGAIISRRLVNRLLNDGSDNPDELPILQHALMRTWTYWEQHRANGEPIDIDDYVAIGGVSEALSRHAEEAYAELSNDWYRGIAKRLFQALTEKGPDNREIRRPTSVGKIAAVSGATTQDVISVIDQFRKAGRSFLTPSAEVPLDANSVIDISHESLIRGWKRLDTWVDEETESAKVYKRLAETAALYDQGRAGLWHDPDLANAIAWREKETPNAAWANDYHPGFERAIAFLDASAAARDAAEAEKERTRRDALRRARLFTGTVTALLALAVVAFLFAWRDKVRANQAEAAAKTSLKEAEIQRNNARASLLEAERQRNNARQMESKALESAKLAELRAKEAVEARNRESAESKIANQNQQMALDLERSTVRKYKSLLPGASEDVRSDSVAPVQATDVQSAYEDLLTRSTSMLDKILQQARHNHDALGLRTETWVALPELHFRQGKTKLAEQECAENEQRAEKAAQAANDPGERILGSYLLATTAVTRQHLKQQKIASADAQKSVTEADSVRNIGQAKRDSRDWQNLALAYHSAGEVEKDANNNENALIDYQKAADALASIPKPSFENRRWLLYYLQDSSALELALKRNDDAFKTMGHTIDVGEQFVRTSDKNTETATLANDLVWLYSTRGDNYLAQKKYDEAENDYLTARRRAGELPLSPTDYAYDRAALAERVGNVLSDRAASQSGEVKDKNLKRALELYTSSLGDFQKFDREEKLGDAAERKRNVAIAERNMGRIELALKSRDEARKAINASILFYQDAVKASPRGQDIRMTAVQYDALASLEHDAKNKPAEQQAYEDEMRFLAPWAAKPSATKEERTQIALLRTRLGDLAHDAGHDEEALREYGYATETLEAWTKEFPATNEMYDAFARIYIGKGDILRTLGRPGEALKEVPPARKILDRIDKNTETWKLDRAFFDEREGLYLSTQANAEKDGAKQNQEFQRAQECFRKSIAEFKDVPALAESNAVLIGGEYELLVDAVLHTSGPAAASKALDEELAFLRAMAERPKNTAGDKIRFAKAIASRADFDYKEGDFKTARDERKQEIDYLKTFVSQSNPSSEEKELLTQAFGVRSWIDVQLGKMEDAVSDAKTGFAYDDTQFWILTNQAHGLLFSGHVIPACRLYLENASKLATPGDAKTTFADSVYGDFKVFREKPPANVDLKLVDHMEVLLKNKAKPEQACTPQILKN